MLKFGTLKNQLLKTEQKYYFTWPWQPWHSLQDSVMAFQTFHHEKIKTFVDHSFCCIIIFQLHKGKGMLAMHFHLPGE